VANPRPQNYEDLSTDKGFQFRFFCDACSEGFTSRFMAIRRPSRVGAGEGARSGVAAEEVDDSAYDAALKRAAAEMERHLRFCKDCGQWVCARSCWNAEEKLCKDCAPPAEGDEEGEEDWEESEDGEDSAAPEPGRREGGPRLVECLNCQQMVEDRSFCSECGESLRGVNVCPGCDAELPAGAKFCSICGAKL
jgi:hypothetical protein